jgi:hypothetical protein
LAGLAVGFWANVDELKQQWQVDHVFQRAQDAKVVQGSRKKLGACGARSKSLGGG